VQPHAVADAAGPRPRAVDESLDCAETAALLGRAIRALPPRCREAFVLSRDAGLTHDAIAQIMGTSVRTVESHVGRALAALRTALARRNTAPQPARRLGA